MGLKKNKNICSINGCYNKAYLTYLSFPVCLEHWIKHTDTGFNLKIALNIKEIGFSQETKKESQITLSNTI